MKKYFTLELKTTKKGNHVLNVPSDTIILDKNGNKVNPIFENEEMKLCPSKPGTFIVTRDNDDILLVQLVKIFREVSEEYKDKRSIKEVPYTGIKYTATAYLLNVNKNNSGWEVPLIDRIKKEVEAFVL